MLDRRTFIGTLAAGAGCVLPRAMAEPAAPTDPVRADYRGPNIVIIRFGGGVRRRETIDPQHTYSPWFLRDFCKRGTLYPQMMMSELASVDGHPIEVVTSHGQGTLNILTGRYDLYKDIEDKFLTERFEARVPTLFEYMRKAYNVPHHQTLLVNGEDRTSEEFYSFSNHHLFGVNYRCSVLSLYRFKCHLLRRQIASGKLSEREMERTIQQLGEKESLDYRRDTNAPGQGPQIEALWDAWRAHYGDSGFVNPRGDRLLTELSLWAIEHLKPRLMMVNFQDPDYVHWGNVNHYTRSIAVIDEGIRSIYEACQRNEAYRDNTIFVVVPDCGRDNNRLVAVPCQHHFNSASAREIFGLFVGPGIRPGVVVDKPVDQVAVAPTVAKLMGTSAVFAEGDILEDAIA